MHKNNNIASCGWYITLPDNPYINKIMPIANEIHIILPIFLLISTAFNPLKKDEKIAPK